MCTNIASKADQEISQPAGTDETKNSPTGESVSGEEPFGTKGESFERALQGTPPQAGATPAAPAPTQHDVSDCTSESGTSVRQARGKRSASAKKSPNEQVVKIPTFSGGNIHEAHSDTHMSTDTQGGNIQEGTGDNINMYTDTQGELRQASGGNNLVDKG